MIWYHATPHHTTPGVSCLLLLGRASPDLCRVTGSPGRLALALHADAAPCRAWHWQNCMSMADRQVRSRVATDLTGAVTVRACRLLLQRIRCSCTPTVYSYIASVRRAIASMAVSQSFTSGQSCACSYVHPSVTGGLDPSQDPWMPFLKKLTTSSNAEKSWRCVLCFVCRMRSIALAKAKAKLSAVKLPCLRACNPGGEEYAAGFRWIWRGKCIVTHGGSTASLSACLLCLCVSWEFSLFSLGPAPSPTTSPCREGHDLPRRTCSPFGLWAFGMGQQDWKSISGVFGPKLETETRLG